MNFLGRFYVKANFIKAAKDNWVPAEVRLLTDDIDTFLCIKSRPMGFGGTEEDMKSIFSGMSATGTISSAHMIPQPTTDGTIARPFTALCNLSEYKSCSILTVSVNAVGLFALKLIPAGIFGNKRLYLAMSSETEATTWMSMIKANLGKKRKSSQISLPRDSLTGTLRTTESQDTFRADSSTNAGSKYDLDIDTIDNEVYEPCSARDLIPATIQQRGDFEKLRLSKVDCFLRLTEDRMELLDHNGDRVLHWFPYLLIRRFGAVGGVLRVDAGRRCSTGDGHFFFACSPTNSQPVDAIVSQIRQLALEAKQRLRQEQAARQSRQNLATINNDVGFTTTVGDATRPPPVPSKSLDSGSGRGSGRGSSSSAVESGSKGSWWNYKRASSIPPPSTKGPAAPAEEMPNPQQLKAETVSNSAISKNNSFGKATEDGVFMASPRKISTESTTPAVVRNAHETPPPVLYDNVPSGDSERTSERTLGRRLQGSPSAPRSPNGNPSRVTGRNASETWQITGGIEATSGRQTQKTLKTSSKDEDLPPAPEPPAGFRNEDSIKVNGCVVMETPTPAVTNPPAVAPKPSIQYPPKTFDLNCYRPAPENSNFNWLSPISRMRNYRSYSDANAEQPDTVLAPPKSSPAKSLSFGSGVYESEENGSDLSRLNLRGLDDVLQELRDANENVSSAVQAAERQRRANGLVSPCHNLSKPTASSTSPTWRK